MKPVQWVFLWITVNNYVLWIFDSLWSIYANSFLLYIPLHAIFKTQTLRIILLCFHDKLYITYIIIMSCILFLLLICYVYVLLNMCPSLQTACTIVRAEQSIDYADPSVAQRKHRVGGEIPSLAKVNVNKVAIFYGIVWNGINWTGMIFLSKYTYVQVHLCAQHKSCPKRTEWHRNERTITWPS